MLMRDPVGVPLRSIPGFLKERHRKVSLWKDNATHQQDNSTKSASLYDAPSPPPLMLVPLAGEEGVPTPSAVSPRMHLSTRWLQARQVSVAPETTIEIVVGDGGGGGGEHDDAGDTSCRRIAMTVSNPHLPTRRVRVSGCHAIAVADFCGVGGYQQVLLLPKAPHLKTSSGDHFLRDVLLGSVLTDGMEWWLPPEKDEKESHDRMFQEASAAGRSAGQIFHLRLLPTTQQIGRRSNETENHNASPMKSPALTTSNAGPSSGWRRTLEVALQDRLAQVRLEEQRQWLRRQQREQWIQKSRSILQSWSGSAPGYIGAAEWKVWEIRYRSKPCDTIAPLSRTSNVTTVALFLEVDLVRVNGSPRLRIQNVHLSASLVRPTDEDQDCKPQYKVTTRSGLVPVLGSTDDDDSMVTILMLVHVESPREIDRNKNTSNNGIGLTIHGHWTSNTVPSSPSPLGSSAIIPTTDSPSKRRRYGSALVGFVLPPEAAIVSLPLPSNEGSLTIRMQTVRYDDAESTSVTAATDPKGVVYDFRQPRFVDVDVSSLSLSPPLDCKKWVHDLNHSLLDTFHCVDIVPTNKKACWTLALYCYPALAYNELLRLLRQRLPGQAALVERTTEQGQYDYE